MRLVYSLPGTQQYACLEVSRNGSAPTLTHCGCLFEQDLLDSATETGSTPLLHALFHEFSMHDAFFTNKVRFPLRHCLCLFFTVVRGSCSAGAWVRTKMTRPEVQCVLCA